MNTLLQNHTDLLFQLALLLTGDERHAHALLRTTLRRAYQTNPPPVDLPDLVGVLIAALHDQQRTLSPPRTPPPRAATSAEQLLHAVTALPLSERIAVALHLFIGLDRQRAAQIGGTTPDGQRDQLLTAMQRIAPRVGVHFPETPSDTACSAARNLLALTDGRLLRDPVLRAHLATCTGCRAFDQAWSQALVQIEQTLRTYLRSHMLDAQRRDQLLAEAQPRAPRDRRQLLRFAVPPIGVLLLIAALILPGMFNRPAALPPRNESAADPRSSVQQALDRVTQPLRGVGVWHGRWEILWPIGEDAAGAIYADAWVDPADLAHHRLQLISTAGGAPFEFQLGDGHANLWYWLDPGYYPTLFGHDDLTDGPPNAPLAVHRVADQALLTKAWAARVQSGAWDLGPSYLRQAAQATDLRSLGRNREGDHMLQLLSFTGYSPLAPPPRGGDEATNERITILLAIDSDYRLVSATELLGPPGTTQTGRVTWKLIDEEWLATQAQITPAFQPIGTYPPRREIAAADPHFPLRDQDELRALRSLSNRGIYVPTTIPTDTATLLFMGSTRDDNHSNRGLHITYVGPGRWMTIHLRSMRQLGAGERSQIGPWQVQIVLLRAWNAALQLNREDGVMLRIDAHGYTHDELIAIVASLRQN